MGHSLLYGQAFTLIEMNVISPVISLPFMMISASVSC